MAGKSNPWAAMSVYKAKQRPSFQKKKKRKKKERKHCSFLSSLFFFTFREPWVIYRSGAVHPPGSFITSTHLWCEFDSMMGSLFSQFSPIIWNIYLNSCSGSSSSSNLDVHVHFGYITFFSAARVSYSLRHDSFVSWHTWLLRADVHH